MVCAGGVRAWVCSWCVRMRVIHSAHARDVCACVDERERACVDVLSHNPSLCGVLHKPLGCTQQLLRLALHNARAACGTRMRCMHTPYTHARARGMRCLLLHAGPT